jgi:hypothetical protein
VLIATPVRISIWSTIIATCTVKVRWHISYPSWTNGAFDTGNTHEVMFLSCNGDDMIDDMIWYDMIWYDMIWYDMISIYDIWYDSDDMIWYRYDFSMAKCNWTEPAINYIVN